MQRLAALPRRPCRLRDEIEFTDGRLLIDTLARSAEPSFDLVIVALPDPETAALNRFFTLQFYEAVARLLRPGGVLATRVSSAAGSA